MLLAQKAYVEGAFALTLYAARLVDDLDTAESEPARGQARLLLELLTPVVKSWPSQFCLEANSLAIQVHGGYGYTRDYPVEQYWRDNRLNMIHEGTHGIQAMDLLGRKVFLRQGSAMALFGREIGDALDAASRLEPVREFVPALRHAWSGITQTVQDLGPLLASDSRVGLANASAFLEAFGHTVVAWTWLRQACAAARAMATAPGDEDLAFYRGKLQACRWFFRWELPRIDVQLARLRERDDTTLAMSPDWF
jgi:butyryl-CoA dehydrogenase